MTVSSGAEPGVEEPRVPAAVGADYSAVSLHWRRRHDQRSQRRHPHHRYAVRHRGVSRRGQQRIGGYVYEVEWEINVKTHKKENAVVSVIEPIPGDREVLRESQPHEKLEAPTLCCLVPVPQEGSARVTCRVRMRF
jgi:hypothetical protein